MSKAIETLLSEHRTIEKVLDALEIAAEKEVGLDFYERAVEFFAHFADGTHHAKEEERLFPLMEEKGVPRDGGPIGVMCHEHGIGRRCIAAMKEAIEAEDRVRLRGISLEYAAMLRAHIAKEDNVLFPMGVNILSADELERLDASFAEVPEAAAYVQLAADLLAEARA
ncbi:MAG: hemerythrin domain-containing protein [Planctomycetota bacterium]|jgi:hemerythrin-like domain-containing protein